MGRIIEIPLSQQLINKINAQTDFTYRKNELRYVVGVDCLFQGANPSLFYKNIYEDVNKMINIIKEGSCITFGGWYYSDINTYFVDVGIATDNLEHALKEAVKAKQTHIWDSVDKKNIKV